MKVRWIYTTPGQPAYYRDGNNIYDGGSGKADYFVNGVWWFETESGAAAYYEADDTVFTANGIPAFYYGT